MPFLLEEGSWKSSSHPTCVQALWPQKHHVSSCTHKTDGAWLLRQRVKDAATNSFKDKREPLIFSTKWSKVKVTNAACYFSNYFSWLITPKGEFRNINLT